MDQETRLKIQFHSDSKPKTLVESVHPSQLEKRFGGLAQSPVQCFPPVMPSDEYGFDPSLIMSEEGYERAISLNPGL